MEVGREREEKEVRSEEVNTYTEQKRWKNKTEL